MSRSSGLRPGQAHFAAALTFAAVSVTTGCSHAGSEHAQLTGTLISNRGGPTSGTVTLRRSDATAPIVRVPAVNGSFSVKVEPGVYMITGSMPTFHDFGDDFCKTDTSLTKVSAPATSVVVWCPTP